MIVESIDLGKKKSNEGITIKPDLGIAIKLDFKSMHKKRSFC